MRRFLRDPLAGFVAAAAGVFLLFAALGAKTGDPVRTIEITAADIDRLKASFEAVWFRAPGDKELEQLVEERVKEELYDREARAMGLDRDDGFLRQHLRRKLEFPKDDEPTSGPPTLALSPGSRLLAPSPRAFLVRIADSVGTRSIAFGGEPLEIEL